MNKIKTRKYPNVHILSHRTITGNNFNQSTNDKL